jgi:hypothetical protein
LKVISQKKDNEKDAEEKEKRIVFPKTCVIQKSGTQTDERCSRQEPGPVDAFSERIDESNKTHSE